MPFFITKNGQTYGPHEADEIAVFLAAGDFLPEDFCWQEGWPEWRPISSILPDKPVRSAPNAIAAAPPVATPPPPLQNGHIPNDIEIIGTLKLPDERTVTCRVEGEIQSPSTVIIAKDTQVKAHIRAESVIIFGRVEGEVHATDRAVLKSTCTLLGDIHAARVLVEDGATFNGKSHVNSKSVPKAKSPATSASRKATRPGPAT